MELEILDKNAELSESKIAEKFIHNFAYVGIAFDVLYAIFSLVALKSMPGFVANFSSAILLLIVIYIRKKEFISRLFSENLLISICYFTLIFLIFQTGGITSPIVPWFAIMNSVSLTLINKRSALIWTFIALLIITFLWGYEYFGGHQIPNQYAGKFFTTWVFLCSWGLIFLSLMIVYVIDDRNLEFVNLLKNKNEELQKQKEEIENLQKYKEQFLANITHELRTPLNAIKGIAQLLTDTQDEEEKSELIDGLKKSSDHLLILINDILDFSKLNASKIELNQQPFSINENLKTAFQLSKINAANKPIDFKLNLQTLPTSVVGDESRLTQILINLLGNAIKFTEKGSITLSASTTFIDDKNALVKIEISDTGIGIAENKLKAIFDDFTQADETISSRFGGTGLGLGITKKLVELHGGTIDCKSWLQAGTTFTVTLPFIYSNEFKENKTAILKSEIDTYDIKMNLLIADDNHFNRMVAEKLIRKSLPNATLFLAENGLEVLKIMQQTKIDLILMDVKMPEMDGNEATKKIRANGSISQPKIIAMTANTALHAIEECMSVGMNDYLSKPFYKNDLMRKIERAMNELVR